MPYLTGMGTFRDWSAFYDTTQWEELRRATLRKQGCVCRNCGATNTELHVDHIRPRSLYPHLSLDPDNLQVLCRACNMAKGSKVIDYRNGPKHTYVPPQLYPPFAKCAMVAALVILLVWMVV